MKQHEREKGMDFDLGIKAKLSSSEAAVKVASRATFPSQAVNVFVYKHTFTHTRIHHHMRIRPPDLAALFPSSGRWGISFLAMCCFLASEILYSFFLKGAVMVFPSLQSHLSLLLSSLFPSSSLCVCFSFSFHLLPFLH